MEDFVSQEEFNSHQGFMLESQYHNILKLALESGVLVEVVMSSFRHKEQFKDASLLQCLQVGAGEWDM